MQSTEIASILGAAHVQITCAAPSGFELTSLITPGIVFLSVCVALFGVSTARAVAKQRATLDFIEKVESSDHYRKLAQSFSRLRRGKGFEDLHDPRTDEKKTDRNSVIDYLNHYELVSIGVKQNILDAKIYKNWMASAFVRDWNAASSFIQRQRWKWDETTLQWKYNAAPFRNYQSVARSWSKEAVQLDANSAPPPKSPAGPGNEKLPDIDGVDT